MSKRPYDPPRIETIGTVAQKTLAQDNNGLVDQSFVGFPVPLPPNIAS